MFKLKKFAGVLALTIALAQVVTAVPVHATEGTGSTVQNLCRHGDACGKESQPGNVYCEGCSDLKQKYEYAGNGTHKFIKYCEGCTLKEETTEECDYNGSVECIYCKEPTRCEHPDCSNPIAYFREKECAECLEQKDWTLTMTAGNAEYHILTEICGKCGIELESWEEEHSDDYDNESVYDGYCACGYYVGAKCIHLNCNNDAAYGVGSTCSTCAQAPFNGTCEKIDDNYHMISGECGACGTGFDAGEGHTVYNSDGTCICGHYVGIKENETACSHTNIEEVYAYTVGKENEGHMTLEVCKSCDYVNPVPNSNEPHEFNTSGYCGKCGYDPNAVAGNGSSGECGSTGGSNSTISGNNIPKPSAPTVTPSTPAPTAAEIHAQKAAQVEAKQKKVVTTASGEVVKTAIAGVYEVSSLSGTAVNTPKAEVQKAIGLSDEEIAAGTNASIYMSDFVSKEDRAALNNAAASVGKNVLSMIVSDMYSITKDGKITKLHSSKEPVSLMFGLPKYAVDANRTYSMICVTADGKVVELKDTDNDPSTLTVDTTVFGKYVIVY